MRHPRFPDIGLVFIRRERAQTGIMSDLSDAFCAFFTLIYFRPTAAMLAQQKQQIAALFQAALAPILAGTDISATVVLERPRDPAHGD